MSKYSLASTEVQEAGRDYNLIMNSGDCVLRYTLTTLGYTLSCHTCGFLLP